ncbi:MAG: hypothetical protein DWQ35_15305 [Planctomycetota bacterium]|nr:MAG: hypothetical protein DWQ35_15305 [Planctomycetota bacterium]REK22184.1 MAG: hypothetical protein DWQ42_17665 [Planctomycetota bacterium]REK44294.1 MAG: hypothetical protein DWQ46_10390 [Planctomycetota bacterium]
MNASTVAKLFPLFLLLYIAAVLYGASYQQFRHFDVHDPRGLGDADEYLAMAAGDYCGASVKRRFRPLVPLAASLVRKPLSRVPALADDEQQLSILAFYVVNFAFVAATAYLLFWTLAALGFDTYLGLIGVAIFSTSRVTVFTTAAPLADSIYFLAIAAIFYLAVTDRLLLLAALGPLLVLAKEPVIVFLLFPLLKRKRTAALIASAVVSLLAIALCRRYLQGLCPAEAETGAAAALLDAIGRFLGEVPEVLSRFATLRGLHDLQNGFSFFLLFAVFGYFLNRRERRYDLPGYLLLAVPVSLVLAVIGGNVGRTFFTAFVAVIPLALVFIERMVEISGLEPGQRETV